MQPRKWLQVNSYPRRLVRCQRVYKDTTLRFFYFLDLFFVRFFFNLSVCPVWWTKLAIRQLNLLHVKYTMSYRIVLYRTFTTILLPRLIRYT